LIIRVSTAPSIQSVSLQQLSSPHQQGLPYNASVACQEDCCELLNFQLFENISQTFVGIHVCVHVYVCASNNLICINSKLLWNDYI